MTNEDLLDMLDSIARSLTFAADAGMVQKAAKDAAAALREAREEVEAMRARKDAAYEERNRVVAALAKCYPSGIARTTIEGWSDDWHGCVYILMPTGQVSWHYHDSQAWLFANLRPFPWEWDGHTTEQKYARLLEFTGIDAAMKPPGGEGSSHE